MGVKRGRAEVEFKKKGWDRMGQDGTQYNIVHTLYSTYGLV